MGRRRLIAGMNWCDQDRTLQLHGKGETWGTPSQVQDVLLEERKRKEGKIANTSCLFLSAQTGAMMKRGRRDGVVDRVVGGVVDWVMFRGRGWSRVTETSARLSPLHYQIWTLLNRQTTFMGRKHGRKPYTASYLTRVTL